MSSLTSTSKRYSTLNVVCHDYVRLCSKNVCQYVSVSMCKKIVDYTVTCLDPTSSTNISYLSSSCCNPWRKTIPDNHLVQTFYKISLSGCPRHHSLPVVKTWAFSIDIPSCNEIHRSVYTTKPLANLRVFGDSVCRQVTLSRS